MKVFRLSLEEPDSREPWLPPLLELPDEERLLELLPELPELLLDPLELRLELLEPLLLLPELLLPPLEFLLLLELRLLELRLLELRLLELRLLLDRDDGFRILLQLFFLHSGGVLSSCVS